MKKKDMYVSPQVEVIEMENEGVIAASGNSSLSDMGNADWVPKTSSYNSSNANSGDLEDMINDILTIEN